MNNSSTFILRGAICGIALIVLAVCIFVFPGAITSGTGDYRPIIAGMYVTAVPFFIALYQALVLLGLIDNDRAFSDLSVKALQRIKYCAAVISGMYAAGMPYIYVVAQKDDAPGVVALGCIIVFASFIIAIFSAVLQKLLQNAVDIQSENDLTV